MKNLTKLAFLLSIFTIALGATLVLTPQDAWASANPCEVRCTTNNFYLICTWSWAGDPNYCCWTHPQVGCQSYNCNTGALAVSHLSC